MHELRRLEHMSKEQREAYILALKPPATATEEERQRFELVSQYAVEAYPFEIMQGIRSAAFSVLLR